MTRCNPNPLISVVKPQDRLKALEWVFGFLPPPERVQNIAEAGLQRCPNGMGPFDGLLGAYSDGKLVAAMFSQLLGGRTASIWLPVFRKDNDFASVTGLFAKTWDFLARHDVVVAQVALPSVGPAEEMLLEMGGFSHAANLNCLVATKDVFPADIPDCCFHFQPYDTARHQEWIEMLTKVNKNTLDCVKLGEMWNSTDFLDVCGVSEKGRGDFCFLVKHENRPAGCLLLADHARHHCLEMLYLGLIPKWRGRGLGKVLVRQAQWLARRAGRRKIVVAVDEKNSPARKTYESAGFTRCQHRRMYIRQIFPRPIGMDGLNRFSTDSFECGEKKWSEMGSEKKVFCDHFAD